MPPLDRSEKLTVEDAHALLVSSITKSPESILSDLDATKCDLIHMSMGIAGESGELLDAIKKHVMYNKPLDVENVIEELGDLEFYMERMRRIIGVSRTDILSKNTRKLSKRYHSGYSDKSAQERVDKNGPAS